MHKTPNMKKVITLFFICLFSTQSYSQLTLLEDAYKKKSEEKLKDFFDYWQAEIPPISGTEYQSLSEIEKDVYDVFCSFYNPIDLERIGSSEWSDTIYQNVKYLIVQNSLQFRVQDKVYFTEEEKMAVYKRLLKEYGQQDIDSLKLQIIPGFAEEWVMEELAENDIICNDTIINFRPKISIDNKNIVYLNSSFNTGITSFLGTRIKKKNERLNYVYYLSEKEVTKRQAFIEKNIKIWRGHWGAYWQLLTYPQVNIMVFDKNREYVKVFFRIVYQGGEAYLKKENGKWSLISSKLTWIE